MRRLALTMVAVLCFGGASGSALANQKEGKAPAKKAVAAKATNKKPAAGKPAVEKTALKKNNARKSAVRPAVAKGSSKKKNVTRVSAKQSMAAIVPAAPTMGERAGLHLTKDPLDLRSNVALVVDQKTAHVLFEKNANYALPIASVTKLMTALVVVEAGLDLTEQLSITDEDIDREKHTSSRLGIGSRLSRDDLLHIALMSSENRAASALGRHYPGGLPAFVKAMNDKARSLGMTSTHYVDSTGLSRNNVSSAHDLARLAVAAYRHHIIREYSTDKKYVVDTSIGRSLQYGSSNRLISGNAEWNIGLQKTGFINEAGHCLVMQTTIDNRPVVMVFLDSKGKLSPVGDAQRLRKWIGQDHAPVIVSADGKDATEHVQKAAGKWMSDWDKQEYTDLKKDSKSLHAAS